MLHRYTPENGDMTSSEQTRVEPQNSHREVRMV